MLVAAVAHCNEAACLREGATTSHSDSTPTSPAALAERLQYSNSACKRRVETTIRPANNRNKPIDASAQNRVCFRLMLRLMKWHTIALAEPFPNGATMDMASWATAPRTVVAMPGLSLSRLFPSRQLGTRMPKRHPQALRTRRPAYPRWADVGKNTRANHSLRVPSAPLTSVCVPYFRPVPP